MMYINIENFNITEFYRYPSYVNTVINEYDEMWHSKPTGDKGVKRLFESALSVVSKKLGRDVTDNKIAFKLVHKGTGREIIVGYKDGCYRIGLDVFCEAPSHTIKL